ncbi:MAG: 2-amino-4-hydroxy-6-hydroxymethyldihydropteridine diphosphokinase [Bacteroidota bacterium]
MNRTDSETAGGQSAPSLLRDTAAPPRALVAIALGANLGDRIGQLRAAVAALDAHPDVTVTRCSPVYEAEAHTLDGTPQPAYLNAVVTAATSLAPEALLDVLLAIEQEAGRTRAHRWASRTLDLDLLLYADLHLDTARLSVPHPRLAERRFVLQPLADLAPDRVVPRWNATVADLLAACPDRAALRRTDFALRDDEPQDASDPVRSDEDASHSGGRGSGGDEEPGRNRDEG